MSEPVGAGFLGELPPDAVRVLLYEVGHGTYSYVNETGGSTLPIVTMKPNNGPLQYFVAPDAMKVAERLDAAAVEAMRLYDPALRKLPTPKELQAQRLQTECDSNRRKRVVLTLWLAAVVVGIAIAAAGPNLSVWGAIQGTLWVLGVMWLAEVVTLWVLERQQARRKRRYAAK